MAAHRLPGAARATEIIARWPRVLELARRLREGLAVASRPGTLVAALAFSALAWTASTCTFLAAGQAVGVELSVAEAALLTSGVALVTIIPSGPGYVGTFELTVVAIAEGLGIPRDDAFALGLLVHLMILRHDLGRRRDRAGRHAPTSDEAEAAAASEEAAALANGGTGPARRPNRPGTRDRCLRSSPTSSSRSACATRR